MMLLNNVFIIEHIPTQGVNKTVRLYKHFLIIDDKSLHFFHNPSLVNGTINEQVEGHKTVKEAFLRKLCVQQHPKNLLESALEAGVDHNYLETSTGAISLGQRKPKLAKLLDRD